MSFRRLPAVTAHRGGDVGQNDFNERVSGVLKSVLGKPLFDYEVIKDVAIGTSATKVTHRLGRPYAGWIVVRRTDSVVPYEATPGAGEESDPARCLWLTAASATTVTLLVF